MNFDPSIFLVILGLVVVVQTFLIAVLVISHQNEKDRLLNRVMARDFIEYKTYENDKGAPTKSKGSAHRLRQKQPELDEIIYD